MALRRLSTNEDHDITNRNFMDDIKSTPMQLFKDQNCEQSNIAAEIEQTTPRNEAWDSLWFHIFELFVISPTIKRITPVPPNAPIKSKKSFSKVGLKPKKLHFTNKEKDRIDENCFQQSADYSIKALDNKAIFSKEKYKLKEKSSKIHQENLSAMLRNIRLETDDKENKQYERYERKARDDHYSAINKERTTKCSNNCTQTLKLNRNSKDKFVHFRI